MLPVLSRLILPTWLVTVLAWLVRADPVDLAVVLYTRLLGDCGLFSIIWIWLATEELDSDLRLTVTQRIRATVTIHNLVVGRNPDFMGRNIKASGLSLGAPQSLTGIISGRCRSPLSPCGVNGTCLLVVVSVKSS